MYYVISGVVRRLLWYFLTGRLKLGDDVAAYTSFWERFVGATANGLTLAAARIRLWVFLALVFG